MGLCIDIYYTDINEEAAKRRLRLSMKKSVL